MTKPLLTLFVLLVLIVEQATATYFVYNGDANCTYPVTVSVKSVSCYTVNYNQEEATEENTETEYCTFGDHMFISGEMTLEENLPDSEMCVTTKVCVLGFVCRTYKETMDVCNAVGVSNEADGTACPNAGTFYFGTSAKIPGKSYLKLGSGWGVTVKVIAEDCNEYKNYAFQCETSFTTISSGESESSTMMISGAALIGVVAAVAIFVRRRQIVLGDNDDEQRHGFEMMNDKSSVLA